LSRRSRTGIKNLIFLAAIIRREIKMICHKCHGDESYVLSSRPVYTFRKGNHNSYKYRTRICKECAMPYRTVEFTITEEMSQAEVLQLITDFLEFYGFDKEPVKHRFIKQDSLFE
jgi:transcriptional regulator NrdR family protein